jgi:hypothetical protein
MRICKKGLHWYSKESKCCIECKKNNTKIWRISNKEDRKIYNQIWHTNNLDKCRLSNSVWQKANILQCNNATKDWRKRNQKQHKDIKKIWCNSNIDKCRASSAKRRATKLKATPKWLSKEQFQEIQEFYTLAQELAWLNQDGKALQVDHIVPLQNEFVCGLHVPWNLQLLSEKENLIKHNKFDFTFENKSWQSLISDPDQEVDQSSEPDLV